MYARKLDFVAHNSQGFLFDRSDLSGYANVVLCVGMHSRREYDSYSMPCMSVHTKTRKARVDPDIHPVNNLFYFFFSEYPRRDYLKLSVLLKFFAELLKLFCFLSLKSRYHGMQIVYHFGNISAKFGRYFCIFILLLHRIIEIQNIKYMLNLVKILYITFCAKYASLSKYNYFL